MNSKSKKALQILGLEPKPKHEPKPTIIEKSPRFKKAYDESDDEDNARSDNSDISTSKLYDTIQKLKNDSDLSSVESESDLDIKPKTSINIFTPKPKQIEKQPIKKSGYTINIPKDRFIDQLEKLRLQREQQEQEKQDQQLRDKQLQVEQKKEKFQNKYLKQLLSIDSDLDTIEDDEFMEYKLRRELSLDEPW